jgi:hypothetical protein
MWCGVGFDERERLIFLNEDILASRTSAGVFPAIESFRWLRVKLWRAARPTQTIVYCQLSHKTIES